MLPSLITMSATALTLSTGTHATLSHSATHVRALPAVMMAADGDERALNSGSKCSMLTGDHLSAVTDLMHDRDHSEYGYTVCDSPSDDPNTTCFLKPDSWSEDLPSKGEWVCLNMLDKDPSMHSEDSY